MHRQGQPREFLSGWRQLRLDHPKGQVREAWLMFRGHVAGRAVDDKCACCSQEQESRQQEDETGFQLQKKQLERLGMIGLLQRVETGS